MNSDHEKMYNGIMELKVTQAEVRTDIKHIKSQLDSHIYNGKIVNRDLWKAINWNKAKVYMAMGGLGVVSFIFLILQMF